MKRKILILGSGGMLGHMTYKYLQSLDKYDIADVSHSKKLTPRSKILDVLNKKELEDFITQEKPEIVVNCIGVLIKGANSDPSNAIYLNAYLPHFLVKILRKTGGRLIHVSTDCVFSGDKGNYAEGDFRDADDTYGRSKALGEIFNEKDVALRTSIIGPELKEEGEGLFHWFTSQSGEVSGFKEAYWGGVTTLELAKVIDFVIENKNSGLIQVSNGEKISKYDLLRLIKEIWELSEIKIEPTDSKRVDKSLKRSDALPYLVPEYYQMLSELHHWMNSNKELYQQYPL